jgi:GlpG protein
MSRELYRGDLNEDLRPLSALLWQQRIRHRIVEAAGHQQVRLDFDEDRPRAEELLQRWQRGEVRLERVQRTRSGPTRGLPSAARAAPATLAIIALGIAGFLLIYLRGPVEWLASLTFQPFVVVGDRPVFGVNEGQYWRFVTPVFLHFGWLHIVFNCLWCWELGRRIEGLLGSVNLLGLFLATAILSNSIQHLVSGPVLFGGLSGVVYGFLGFAWVAGRLNTRWRSLAPSPGIMLFMVGWLVICVTGVFDVLGFSVANGAHLGGLLAGSVIGLVFAVALRGQGASSP